MRWILLIFVISLLGCTTIEKDGREYLAHDLTATKATWEEIAQEVEDENDKCLQGETLDCWGDPI